MRVLLQAEEDVDGELGGIGDGVGSNFGIFEAGVRERGAEFFLEEVGEIGGVVDFAGFEFPAGLQFFGDTSWKILSGKRAHAELRAFDNGGLILNFVGGVIKIRVGVELHADVAVLGIFLADGFPGGVDFLAVGNIAGF